MTHHEYTTIVNPPRPRTAHDINFGGACFNCGFDPEREAQPPKPAVRGF